MGEAFLARFDDGIDPALGPVWRRWASGGSLRGLPATMAAGLGAALMAERERWPLWLPVAFAGGILAYFSLGDEPGVAILVVVAAISAGLIAVGWAFGRTGAVGLVAGAVLLLGAVGGLGFALSGWHAARVAAPVLAKRLGPVPVSGRVIAVEPGFKGARLTLEDPVIARLGAEATPKRIRLRLLRHDGAGLRLGDTVRLTATLMPPPVPSAPDAYDFARDAWFQRIGAVGFAYAAPVVTAPASAAPAAGPVEGLLRAIAEVRRTIYAKVVAAVPGGTGAVTGALMTGDQGGIPPDIMEAMRDSGLAHLLSISGLHVALVTAILFFGLRSVLALWPALALNWPIKKWAAGLSLVGIALYTLVTGASVPTQRSFLMAGIVLVAVMVDRSAISMRLLAWAAVAVLLVAPESLLGPSFQMSFAAVGGLIAAYEAARPALARLRGDGGLARRFVLGFAGASLTTLVAGIATAAPSLYHFNRVAVLGLVANFGAVPVTSFWVMPWAVLAYLLAPFGLEGLALVPMGWGVEAVIWIARTVASWPGAASVLPVMPPGAFLAVMFGLAWLFLWRTRLRFWGLAFVVLGAGLTVAARPPDVVVAGDASSFAVRDGNRRLVFGGERIGRFERETWMRRAGLDPVSGEALAHLAVPTGAAGALRCDPAACVYRGHGRMVSLIREPSAAAEDCARADVVVALVPLSRRACPGPARLIGRFDLWREGAHAIWLAPSGTVTVRTVAAARGARPWAPVRRSGG